MMEVLGWGVGRRGGGGIWAVDAIVARRLRLFRLGWEWGAGLGSAALDGETDLRSLFSSSL
jgi:hypothetical protein